MQWELLTPKDFKKLAKEEIKAPKFQKQFYEQIQKVGR